MRFRFAAAVLFACLSASAFAQVSPSMDSPETPNGLPEAAPQAHHATNLNAPTPAGSDAANPQSQASDQDQAPAPTIKVGTSLVHLYLNVRDKENQLVTNLAPGDCTVLEEGKPRPIKSFELVKNQPLTLGVLVDTSGSQRRLLPMEQESGVRFLREVLRPATDEAFVITFDIHVDLVEDYTSDIHDLKKALDSVEINTGTGSGDFIPGISKNRGTLLYDAVYLAAHDEFKNEAGRHAMVLLTDGQDEGSRLKLKDAIEAAQRSDATIYVILLYDPSQYGGLGYAGDFDMRKLTQATGGRVYVVGHDGKKLEATFDLINDALHKQFSLTFTPATLDGRYHALQVQCKGDSLKVETRKGYFAISDADTQ